MKATRREALVLAAATAAPVLAGAAPALGAGDDAAKKRSEDELATALQLEQTAVVAYEAIANSGRLSGRATTIFRALQADDRQHADQLITALDALGVKPPIPAAREHPRADRGEGRQLGRIVRDRARGAVGGRLPGRGA